MQEGGGLSAEGHVAPGHGSQHVEEFDEERDARSAPSLIANLDQGNQGEESGGARSHGTRERDPVTAGYLQNLRMLTI
jgi:hypothetical protein